MTLTNKTKLIPGYVFSMRQSHLQDTTEIVAPILSWESSMSVILYFIIDTVLTIFNHKDKLKTQNKFQLLLDFRTFY